MSKRKKKVPDQTIAKRGHAFGRVGQGRSTSFKDKRRVNRSTEKANFKKGDE